MTDDLRRRVVDAMLAVDVANGGKADMYMLADAAIAEIFRSACCERIIDGVRYAIVATAQDAQR